MAFTAVAAIVAGETAITAATVLAAVSEIGIAMSVVGAVTGNKELLQIGSVMGLVGGIGGMVAGAAGGAAAAGAEGLGAASTAADAAGASYEAGANVMDGLTDAAGQTMDASGTSGMDMAADAGSPLTAPSAEMGQPIVQNASATPAVPDATAATPADTLQAPAVQGAVSPQAPVTPYDTGPGSPNFGRDLGQDVGTVGNAAAPKSTSSFLSSLTDFAKNNKELFAGGLQLVGGAFNGMNQRAMWDQKMALEQQRVNQTSYGNTVGTTTPRPGIIAGARG